MRPSTTPHGRSNSSFHGEIGRVAMLNSAYGPKPATRAGGREGGAKGKPIPHRARPGTMGAMRKKEESLMEEEMRTTDSFSLLRNFGSGAMEKKRSSGIMSIDLSFWG